MIVLILALVLARPIIQFLAADQASPTERVAHLSEVSPADSAKSTPATAQDDIGEHLIAFVSIRDGNREIYVMSADGVNASNLTQHPSQDYVPVWSPEGERIAFISDRTGKPELFVMQADGSMVVKLRTISGAKAFGEPSWSPDGQHLAVQLILEFPISGEAYTQIYLVAADGSGSTPMMETEFPLSNLEPKWSPVGNRIASRTLGIMQAMPHAASPSEPEQIRLSRGLTNVGTLAWSPDGMRLAYFANCQYCIDEQDLTPTIHLIDADGKNPQVLHAFEYGDLYSIGMNWSPDGMYLLLLGAEVQSSDQYLYLIARDGSIVTRLADLTQGTMGDVPSWSPDGRQLVYALDENGEAGLYILELQARLNGDPQNGLTRLTASRKGDSTPRWQP
jgi:Tol biopolymer transport system component